MKIKHALIYLFFRNIYIHIYLNDLNMNAHFQSGIGIVSK